MAETTTAAVTDTTQSTAQSAVPAGTSLLTTEVSLDTTATATTDTTAADATAAAQTDKPDGEKQTDKDAKPEGPPEKYEFVAPEGVELDPVALEKFEPVARELGLTSDQANKLVALQAELVAGQSQQWSKQVETWVTSVKADKELGGVGLNGTLSNATRALNQFGTPELKAALDATGMGNHPELVRVFARVGKAMAEDGHVPAGTASNQKRSAAEILYPSQTKTS
jgi:hypothetical protein